jgi:hypothetical protein
MQGLSCQYNNLGFLSMEPLTGAAIAVGSIIATKALEKTGEKVGEKVWEQTGKFLTSLKQGLFWFLCGNEVYTDSFFRKIVLKVLPNKHFTIP